MKFFEVFYAFIFLHLNLCATFGVHFGIYNDQIIIRFPNMHNYCVSEKSEGFSGASCLHGFRMYGLPWVTILISPPFSLFLKLFSNNSKDDRGQLALCRGSNPLLSETPSFLSCKVRACTKRSQRILSLA